MSLAHRLEQCYTYAVYDVLRAMGHRKCVLPSEIRSLHPLCRLTEQLKEETEKDMDTKSFVRKAILQSGEPQQAYLKYGKF